MSERLDITGMRFGRLTAVSRLPTEHQSNGKAQSSWICKCDCGTEKRIRLGHLTSGVTTGCGCSKPGRKAATALKREIEAIIGKQCSSCAEIYPSSYFYRGSNPCKTCELQRERMRRAQKEKRPIGRKIKVFLPGTRFGLLTVTDAAPIKPTNGSTNYHWMCKCDCGSIRKVAGSRLGKPYLSCGCLTSYETRTKHHPGSLDRQCTVCKQTKPVVAFGRPPKTAAGIASQCLACRNDFQRKMNARDRVELTENYIAKVLRISRTTAHTMRSLIQAKSTHLKLKRLIKEKQK